MARTLGYSLIITLPVISYYKTWRQMKYVLVALSILLEGRKKEKKKLFQNWMANRWKMQLWLVHTWHRCDIQKWKDASQCNMYLEKERVGYKQKVPWHKALVDCNRNMNCVDKFDHVKLIHVVNWKCSKLCHKIFRHVVMLVSRLHSSSTMTWLNPRQS